MTHRQDKAALAGLLAELVRMGCAQGHWLFDENVPAMMQAPQGLGVVMLVGAGNDQGIACPNELPEFRVRSEFRGWVWVIDADQPKVLTRGQGENGLDVARAHAAGSDDADANHP